MKISELCYALQKISETEGDLAILIEDDGVYREEYTIVPMLDDRPYKDKPYLLLTSSY